MAADGVAKAAQQPPLFRAQAMRAKLDEPTAEALPEISASSWALLTVVSGLLAAAVILAYLGRVEETSTAAGVLLVRGGPRPVIAQVSGMLAEVAVKPGEMVVAGQRIAQVDTTELSARVQRDSEQLALVEAELARLSPLNTQRYQTELQLLQRKRDLLTQRAELKTVAVRERDQRMQQVEHAALAGVASQSDALGAREATRSAAEELLLIRQQITEVELLLSTEKKTYEAEQDRLRRELQEAQSNLAQSRSVLAMTAVYAPVGGLVESLLATAGQVINTGTVLARIIPDGSVTNAVVFAPVKDAAFLKPGLAAHLEFASFPVSEFGRTPGRVVRVSPDVASDEEVASLLGRAPGEPVIRVEIELLPGAELRAIQDRLRSGERLIGRLNTRERRLIALVFDFLRKWYDP